MRVSGVTVGSWGGGGGYSPWLEEGNWSTNEGIYITSFPWYPFTFSSDIISGPMPHTTKYSKIRLHIFPVTSLTRNSAARLCCFLSNLVWEGWKWRSVAWLERDGRGGKDSGWCLREEVWHNFGLRSTDREWLWTAHHCNWAFNKVQAQAQARVKFFNYGFSVIFRIRSSARYAFLRYCFFLFSFWVCFLNHFHFVLIYFRRRWKLTKYL